MELLLTNLVCQLASGPRKYPPNFGKKLVKLFENMVSEKLGMPELPEVVPPAWETFSKMEFSDNWGDADMQHVCHYLRSGIYLNIPPEFVELMPRKL